MIGILHGSPAATCFGRAPLVNRILCKPDGDVAAAAQGIVVLSPIGDFIESFLDLAASALVEFVGHGLLGRSFCPESQTDAVNSIYSTR